MPAVSQAQRAMLNARFGHAWVQAHHFDNAGPLPKRAKKRKKLKGHESSYFTGAAKHLKRMYG